MAGSLGSIRFSERFALSLRGFAFVPQLQDLAKESSLEVPHDAVPLFVSAAAH